MNQIFLSGFDLNHLLEELRSIVKEEISGLKNESTTSSEGNDPFMDIFEAAKFLKKSKQTLYQYCSTSKIPHYKRGGKNYFKKSELEAWLLEGKVTNSNQAKSIIFTKKFTKTLLK
ncbi:MAG: helix-turn-helix domain-containing protein [Bacteroidetes bacterium]|nr:helix-turn-helix domain-containing protein [Bacteroidota bacterium]